MVHILALAGTDLDIIVDAVGRSPGDVDLALWALVGRQPGKALLQLGCWDLIATPSRAILGQFLREIHP